MTGSDDLRGMRFGRWLAIELVIPIIGRRKWICRCDCGKTCVRVASELVRGATKSCGCIQRTPEYRAMMSASKRVHGLNRTPEYRAWQGMIHRCENKNYESYARYGGRGISVCPEWRHDPLAFIAYMGKRPSSHHSLDRIDSAGNYEPGNVRWATAFEQNNNKDSVIKLLIDGEQLTISQAAIRYCVGVPVIRRRLEKGLTGRDLVVPSIRKDANPPTSKLARAMERHRAAKKAESK